MEQVFKQPKEPCQHNLNNPDRHPNPGTNPTMDDFYTLFLFFFSLVFPCFLPLLVSSGLQATKNPAITTSMTPIITQTQAPTQSKEGLRASRFIDFFPWWSCLVLPHIFKQPKTPQRQPQRPQPPPKPRHRHHQGGLRTLRFTDFLPSPAWSSRRVFWPDN